MAEETLQDRTEQATPKRRDDARRKGQVLRSADVSSFAVIAGSLLGLLAFGPLVASTLGRLAVHNLHHATDIEISITTLPGLAAGWMSAFARAAVAPALVALVVGTGASLLQVGWKPSLETLSVKWERFNVVQGVGRLFGRRSAFQALKDTIKLGLIGVVAYFAISAEQDTFPLLADMSPTQTASLLGAMSLRVGFKIAAALLVIAAIDFAYQKWDHEKNLRMTRQEIREETKQLEGDPQIRARVRHIQREMSRHRMMDDVAQADVVVTHPTHLAVALRYRRDQDAAPVVVAKGADLLATRIADLARELGIPVIESRPLAPSLYRMVKVGVEIPETLFEAAAAVLAMAYRLKEERA